MRRGLRTTIKRFICGPCPSSPQPSLGLEISILLAQQPHNEWRNTMTTLKIATALVLFSTIQPTLVLAQSFSEPAAFAAQHPDRDVFNGGGLTPEARAAAGLENVGGA